MRAGRVIASVAEDIGVGGPMWSRWEHGTKRPSLENAVKIERLSDRSVSIEVWGYEASTIEGMHEVMNHREVMA